MKNFLSVFILLLYVSPVSAEMEGDINKKAYYFVYSWCVNCCEAGEGLHAYISKVVHAERYNYDDLEHPFSEKVKIDYPKGPHKAGYPVTRSNFGYTTRSEAEKDRINLIGEYKNAGDTVHEINW